MKSPFLRRFGMPSPFFDNETGFSPSVLFALAEPGVWYDPSDLTTLFQDTAGTIPVTTPGQTVALALDKSKGLVLGPELVTNGDFSSGAGWTTQTGWSISSGVLTASAAATGTSTFQSLIGLKANTTYRITFDISNYSAGFVYANFFAGATSGWLSGNGQKSFVVTTPSSVANSNFGVTAVSSAFTGTIDNISVRELPGNHATQATAASRPTYGIVPLGGRRNLLTRTEEFENAVWQKSAGSVTANAAVAPNGTTTADKFVENTATSDHYINSASNAVTTATAYTFTCYAKAAERTVLAVYMSGVTATGVTSFNLSTGAVIATSVNAVSSITDAGNGWYRCSVRVTTNATASIVYLYPNTGGTIYQGDGTSGILIWGAQLETGSTATAYQRVGSAFDVTEAGVPSLSYLSFDGIDDFLVTPTITPGIDKAQVFAGVRKLSDAATNNLVSFGNPFGNIAGTFAIDASQVTDRLRVTARGTVQAIATTTNAAYSAPVTGVYTTLIDIAGDNTSGRWNGSSALSSSGDLGTGNFTAQLLHIGRYGGTSSPFNGQIYSLIVRFGANLSTSDINRAEYYVSQQTGVSV